MTATGTLRLRGKVRRSVVLGCLRQAVPFVAAQVVVVLAAVTAGPAAFAGGNARPWRRRGGNLRAEAQAAKDAAAQAFYELDTAHRDVRISVETVTAVDDSPGAQRAAADFAALSQRIDQASGAYISAIDAHDLDDDELESGAASQARAELTRARDELLRVKADLDSFVAYLNPVLSRAETELARLAPAVERARQALLAASNALDAVRSAGLRADDLAARLAALAPELTKLNQGAGKHGVQQTLSRASTVLRAATQIRTEAEQLPARAKEIDQRLVSLRTRAQAVAGRAGNVQPALSELRRRFSLACWQDIQTVPAQAASAVAEARKKLDEAAKARAEQRWPDATALLATARAVLADADSAVSAASDRLRALKEVERDPKAEVERTRFALRDAQRLAMAGRSVPDPRHARPLDEGVERIDRAVAGLTGRHPDYWRFLTEMAAVRETAARVVQLIRDERAAGH